MGIIGIPPLNGYVRLEAFFADRDVMPIKNVGHFAVGVVVRFAFLHLAYASLGQGIHVAEIVWVNGLSLGPLERR